MSRRSVLLIATLTLTTFTFYVGLAGAQTAPSRIPVSADQARYSRGVAAPFIVEIPQAIAAPVPVQNVVAFETALVADLNTAIRNPAALTAGRAKVVVIADTKVFKGFCDTKAIVVVESASVTRLSVAQLQELRNDLTRQVDLAVQQELSGQNAVNRLGQGTYRNRVFTGAVKPAFTLPANVTTPPPAY